MDDQKLKLRVMEGTFRVCRLGGATKVPAWVLGRDFFSITRTEDELSIIAPEGASGEANLPEGTRIEGGWACLKVEGPLDFSLVGVLAALSGTLAEAGVSVFAVPTYDTDYLLVKQRDLEKATEALSEAGHTIPALP